MRLLFVLLSIYSTVSFASRYDLYDDSEYGTGLADEPLLTLFFCVVGFFFSLSFLVKSYSSWKERRGKKDKNKEEFDIAVFVFSLIGYAFMSACLCLPMLYLFKALYGAVFIREYAVYPFSLMFFVILILRKT